MTRIAGVDGTPGGWAVVINDHGSLRIRQAKSLTDIVNDCSDFDIIAIDIPMGLLGVYEIGGRAFDRSARRLLGRPRGSSVFPAPVRSTLDAGSWQEACAVSRQSGPQGKAVTKQAFAILPKIREVDALLQQRDELRHILHEVHPEVSFAELAGQPMVYRKSSRLGREERRQALARPFPSIDEVESHGRAIGLPIEDILDALVACWSAARVAKGEGRRLPNEILLDATGVQMTIWV